MSATQSIRRAYVDAGDLQLHYRSAGSTDNPVLLLLHQSPSSSAMYEKLMNLLADRYYLVAPDTPGFGASDSLPVESQEVEIADYARAMQEFCRALKISSCYLFGHHTGAAIAVQLVHQQPALARAMALSGPTLLTDEQRLELPARASPFAESSDGSHLVSLWRRLRAKDPAAPLAITQRELLSALASKEAYQASYQAVARHDFADMLESICCPVLVFAGDCDPLHGAVAPTLARLQRGVGTHLPGGERTYICERQADVVANALHQFFLTVGAD